MIYITFNKPKQLIVTDKEQIESILWHEVGHLCVDVLKIQFSDKITIDKLTISNEICENRGWCGEVVMGPENLLTYEKVVNDNYLAAFSLLSLISGCFFQSKLGPENLEFEECFCRKKKAIGYEDYFKYHEIPFRLRKLHPLLNANKNIFLDRLELIQDEYKTELLKLKDFQTEISKIISDEVEKIHSKFSALNKPKRYSFQYEGEELQKLTKVLLETMDKNGLKELLTTSAEKIIENINQFTEN